MSASTQKGSKVTMIQDSFSWFLALIPKSIAVCNQSQTALILAPESPFKGQDSTTICQNRRLG